MAETSVRFKGVSKEDGGVRVAYYHGEDRRAFKTSTIGNVKQHPKTKVWWTLHEDGSKFKAEKRADAIQELIAHEEAKENKAPTKAQKEAAPPSSPRSKGQPKWAHVTEEEIRAAREGEGLSWRDVSKKFDLGSPGTARKAWAALTGTPHTDSIMTGRRAPSGSHKSGSTKMLKPKWADTADTEEVRAAVEGGHRMLVKRPEPREPEDIVFTRLLGVKGTRAGVEVSVRCKITGGERTVFAHNILEVR